jgi:glucans biosynthesis protein C
VISEKINIQTSRQHYLDWIRVLAMFGIFFFHNARFFDSFNDWHVKNASTNAAASGLIAFLAQWIMPLFFLIAGAATCYALKSKRAPQFARERILRLLIPFIFGMLVIVVPQAYFQAISHGENLAGYNFFQLYWQYFKTLPQGNTFHLWFLDYLFVFSIIAIPIFIAGKNGQSLISRLAAYFDKPWLLMILLISSLTLVNVFMFPGGFWGNIGAGGWNIIAYMLFFVFGYLIFANANIMESIKKFSWIMLSTGIVATVCLIMFFVDNIADPVTSFGTGKFALAHFVQALNTWCWLLAILGLGYRYLNNNSKFLAYANEAVLPFYVLHQTVIITIGFYVVQWNSGVGLKYLTISTTSFVAIMLIYELLVRRINVFRFLFGMKAKGKPAGPQVTQQKVVPSNQL